MMDETIAVDKLNFSKLNGLIPAVVQDVETRQVLMVGLMNREAVERTVQEKKVIFWSRSRQRLWKKGETSGNELTVEFIQVDCDGDALLVHARPLGPVCHTGIYTCFGDERAMEGFPALEELDRVIQERKRTMPPESYTARLFRGGVPKISQKVGEEAVEVIVASLQDDPTALKEEAADLLYHLLVLLAARGLQLDDVAEILQSRAAR